MARQVLQAGRPEWLDPDVTLQVVVTEGEPDYLTWSTRDQGRPVAVLGLAGAGAWSDELATGIPEGTRVIIRTHCDEAGDRYAADINRTLADRCTVLRAQPEGNDHGDDS